MLELRNAKILDPLHPMNGRTTSLFIDGSRISGTSLSQIDPPTVNRTIDLAGALVLAGGIDIHTHIGGGKVNLARMLMAATPEDKRTVWPTTQTGELYNQMGYTSCFEPAMLLPSARHTHLELADTPHIDSGAYVVLGNEDWLLESLRDGIEDEVLQSLVAWSVCASKALAVKVVNPGGINAFRFNQRTLNVDEPHVHFGVTPRDVIRRLTAAVEEIGLAHPLHVHASNLGVPGNVASTIATLDAAEGRRLHLTHAQFNCYSDDGPFEMGSGAELLSEYVNSHPNITVDVGQVVFGQTVTISADAAAQFRNRKFANPRQWIVNDIECQAGCGVVPIKYRDKQYVHSLQWTIGLELMLLIKDPWRVFLTTDHPNGGPFTSYPHLVRLLMDRTYRESMLERLHPEVQQRTLLREISREYTLDELAIITRCAPAKLLGLDDRGTLADGAVADLAAYHIKDNWESTFETAAWVFKGGEALIRSGKSTGATARCETIHATPDYDASAMSRFSSTIEQILRSPIDTLKISDREMDTLIRRPLVAGGINGD